MLFCCVVRVVLLIRLDPDTVSKPIHNDDVNSITLVRAQISPLSVYYVQRILSEFFFFFLMNRRPPRSPLFPYPPLFRSRARRPARPHGLRRLADHAAHGADTGLGRGGGGDRCTGVGGWARPPPAGGGAGARGAVRGDRKSTRLNSSHGYISYAVFCFKKK